MPKSVSVIVPARNEADTIGNVVKSLGSMPWVDEVIVIDNGSADETAGIARAAGARNVTERRPGMGHAVRAGLAAARNDWVMKVDADLDRFDMTRFALMAAACSDDVGLIKGAWQDPADNMPMTRLLVMPAILRMFPGLAHLSAPNSGIYVVNRSLIAHQEIVGSYAADLDIMLRIYASGARVDEVSIGQISHDMRDIGHYNAMAEIIMAFFLDRQSHDITQELAVMAEDALQVTDGCLGAVAARSRAGGPVTIYLAQERTAAADILRDMLAPFPGTRILPLSMAGHFRPRGPEGRVRFFAPFPVAGHNEAVRAALLARAGCEPGLSETPELLLMPGGQGRKSVENFQPDFALETGQGAEIKRDALARLAQLDEQRVSIEARPREMFQSYESLPDPLRVGIQDEIRLGAGRM